MSIAEAFKEEAEAVISIAETFEVRGIALGEKRGMACGMILGKIDLLVENNYSDEAIIQQLMKAKK